MNGKQAETLAAQFLEQKGYGIVGRNVRLKHWEVDIIAQNSNMMIFVEVKKRKSVQYGFPETFVSPQQQKRIRQVAEAYIFQTNWLGEVRFDIISIVAEGEAVQIEHFEDAF